MTDQILDWYTYGVHILILRAKSRHTTNGKVWIHTTNGISYMSMHIALVVWIHTFPLVV